MAVLGVVLSEHIKRTMEGERERERERAPEALGLWLGPYNRFTAIVFVFKRNPIVRCGPAFAVQTRSDTPLVWLIAHLAPPLRNEFRRTQSKNIKIKTQMNEIIRKIFKLDFFPRRNNETFDAYFLQAAFS
jgi:hypothetical protein